MSIPNLTIDLNFSGSYAPGDVQLLLQEVQIDFTDVAEKEQLIQTGAKHYSEMMSLELAPSAEHQAFYVQALADGINRIAREIHSLALALAGTEQPVVLVSLVRAGLPVGVMLKHALSDLQQPVVHYGVSIVRDRGIDSVAYAYIRERHAFAQLIFVDGWTGKGAISQQLFDSVTQDPDFDGVVRLLTLADVSGRAWLAASGEDWLIPSGILGSTISGLISRSVYRDHQLHGYVWYEHLRELDQSQALIDNVNRKRRADCLGNLTLKQALWSEAQRESQQRQATQVIDWVASHYQIDNLNRIKPSIAEATRVLLRRIPERILLRDSLDNDTRLLRHLADMQGAPVEVVGEAIAPYKAISLIQKRGKT